MALWTRQCAGEIVEGLVHHSGADDLELGTLSWVHWFNTTRLHSSIGHVPPAEYETTYYRHINAGQQPLPGEPSLH